MKLSYWQYVGILSIWCLFLVGGFLLANHTFGTVTFVPEETKSIKQQLASGTASPSTEVELPLVPPPVLDTAEYDTRLLALSQFTPPSPVVTVSTSTDASGNIVTRYATSTPPSPLQYSSSTNVTVSGKAWPSGQPYPLPGALLPFQRILAYYGNFYSTKMGILGEYEPEEVLKRLIATQALWEEADPTTPVLPAIEYIAMVAQADAGSDGMYRATMPAAEIEKAYALAQEIDGILILDIQIGLSPLAVELPKFKTYLSRPDVHFALDPEFSMKSGHRPGTVIGHFTAADINYTIDYLSQIVRENNLPPKVLLVHRFTQNMVQDTALIKATPEVQVVMVMDGWGSPDLKRGTYNTVITPEPVQFAGIKLFYKNDLKPPSTGLLSPAEVLKLKPSPIYIQYQ